MDECDQEAPPRPPERARRPTRSIWATCTFFPGPSAYLQRTALVFDLALTGSPAALPVARLCRGRGRGLPAPDRRHVPRPRASVRRPGLAGRPARHRPATCSGAASSRASRFDRIATQALDRRTQHRAVYFAWDWLEAIGAGEPFDHAGRMAKLQEEFNRSPFGGPTTYAILSAADARGIPTSYLRAEGLMQYGYGRRQVRGVSTTFSTDSQLDSGFTTRKDDCKAFLGRLGFPVPQGDVVDQPRRGDGGGARRSATRWRSSRWAATRASASPPACRTPTSWPRPSPAPAAAGADDHRRDQPRRQRLPPALRQRPLRRRRCERRPPWVEGDGVVDRRAADRARERDARRGPTARPRPWARSSATRR